MAFNTLIVNPFAGPGVGKSMYMAGLYFLLKLKGVDCEMVREHAKDLVWDNDISSLRDQVAVTGEQLKRQLRIDGKVQVMLTDSPIILGLVYKSPNVTPEWEADMIATFKKQNNLNILLTRNRERHPYDQRGREQTEEQAMAKDIEIKKILDGNNIEYVEIEADGLHTIYRMYDFVKSSLNTTVV